MRVLLTGGSGMIGQGVLLECLKRADVTKVVAVGRTPLEKNKMNNPANREPNLVTELDGAGVDGGRARAGVGVSAEDWYVPFTPNRCARYSLLDPAIFLRVLMPTFVEVSAFSRLSATWRSSAMFCGVLSFRTRLRRRRSRRQR